MLLHNLLPPGGKFAEGSVLIRSELCNVFVAAITFKLLWATLHFRPFTVKAVTLGKYLQGNMMASKGAKSLIFLRALDLSMLCPQTYKPHFQKSWDIL